jgi:hypothetical protein
MTTDPIARRSASKRLRRAYGWLGLAIFVYGATFAFVLFSVIGGSIFPPAAAIFAGGLSVTSLTLFVAWERRLPIARRPALWMRRCTAVVLLHSVAFGIAAGAIVDKPAPPTWKNMIAFACATLLTELVAVGLASRSLRRPLSADLAELEVEVLAKIRPASDHMPAWAGNDDVRLTNESLIITVRPDLKWAYVEQIHLADIVGVDIRATRPQDGPWFQIDDGRMLWPPRGDVVVIAHRGGTRRLPVDEPAGFVEVLRAMIRKDASTRKSSSPEGADERNPE